jgi:integrative and conjugative element protein (TIGR02256 family)
MNIFDFFLKRTIVISSVAAKKAYATSRRAYPLETGGLLLGWWDGQKIVIKDVVEVVDPKATHTSWIRYENSSQTTLDHVIERTSDPKLGYVGEWHSHPMSRRASPIDIDSLKKASIQYRNPLVLAVILPEGQLDLHVAYRGRVCRQNTIYTKYPEEQL